MPHLTFAMQRLSSQKRILLVLQKWYFSVEIKSERLWLLYKGRPQWVFLFLCVYQLDNLILSIHKGTRNFQQLNLIVPLFNKVLMYF